MKPRDGSRPKAMQILMVAMIAGGGLALLTPSKPDPRRKLLHPEISRSTNSRPASSNGSVETAQPALKQETQPLEQGIAQAEEAQAVPGSLSDREVLNYIETFVDPQDPDLQPGLTGTSFESLKELDEGITQQVMAKGVKMAGKGFDSRRKLSSLGRLALAHGDENTARGLLQSASKLGSASAHAYLAQLTTPAEHFILLDKAIEGGFRPALAMKDDFQATAVEYLDEKLLHPGENPKPPNTLGVADKVLFDMNPEEASFIIKNYSDWAMTKTDSPRLAFGIGRLAWAFRHEDRAKILLQAATQYGSAGAPAYLAKLADVSEDSERRFSMLKEAVDRGFAYAKPELEEAKGEHMKASNKAKAAIFDPKTFGAPTVVALLYEGKVRELLSGAVSFEGLQTSQLPREIAVQFNRGLMLDYMQSFAEFVEGAEVPFTSSLGVVIEHLKSGTAKQADTKQQLSYSGLAMEQGGPLVGFLAAMNGLNRGDPQQALAMLLNPDAPKKLLETQRQQVKDMGTGDARKLIERIGLEGGNPEPFEKVYTAVKQFVAAF